MWVRGATLDAMRSRTALSVGAATALAAMAALAAAPAQAESYGIDDPADASGSLSDVTSLTARHGSERIAVTVRFEELVRSSAAGISVFLDTDRSERGADYVLSSGLGDGTDYVLSEADGWRGTRARVDCSYKARPKWRRDVFRAVIDRDCLGDPDEVRVSVKVVDPTDGERRVVDWVPRQRRWSTSISSGLGV